MKTGEIWPPLAIGAAFFAAFKALAPAPVPELKVLLHASAPAAAYDTVSLNYVPDYFFLENIFSPLLEYSAGGELVSGAAESFEWAGSEARFRMRSGLKTAGGRGIDAEDAALSVKRLLILGGKQYGFLRDLLCGGAALKKISDPCPGLSVAGGGRTLVMKFAERKTFLFHLLTNISFAVIPKDSLDPDTLRIRDYGNTSGPYYVWRDSGGGNFQLRPNPYHYRYSREMPQKVRIIPLTRRIANQEALDMLVRGEIDYLINALVKNPDDKSKFVASDPGYNINLSQPMRLVYAVFTKKGLDRLTPEERFFIGGKLRVLYKARRTNCDTPGQIFHLDGALSREQLAGIRGRLGGGPDRVIRKKLLARQLSDFFRQDMEEIRTFLPGITEESRSGGGKIPEEPDFFLQGCDVGFQDDVGLLSYYLTMDFFDMDSAEKSRWLAAYTSAPDKKARVRLLRELQFETLAAARVLPIALLPYASVARKPWAFHFPGVTSGDNLWRLRRE